jgi:hypothetical protein
VSVHVENVVPPPFITELLMLNGASGIVAEIFCVTEPITKLADALDAAKHSTPANITGNPNKLNFLFILLLPFMVCRQRLVPYSPQSKGH